MMQKDPGTLFFTSGATEKMGQIMESFDDGDGKLWCRWAAGAWIFLFLGEFAGKDEEENMVIEYAQSAWKNQYIF